MTTTQLSRAAFDRLQAEFSDLTTRGRIAVAQKIETARLMGDLSENGDYHAAKDEQGQMEGRIRQLEFIIDTAEIIEGGDEGIVSAGSIVTIVYEDPILEIQAVDQVSAPGVRGEDRIVNATLHDYLAGLHRKVSGVEVRIHPWMRR